MPSIILSRTYFDRPTLKVGRSPLGKYLVRANRNRTIAAKIIEVEAYVGPQDRACHASRGRTPRTDVLFGPPGVAYVYLIYGMYHCLNVVTERKVILPRFLAPDVKVARYPRIGVDYAGKWAAKKVSGFYN